RADTMAIFVTSQFQGIIGVGIAALLLMRRQPNPFYGRREGARSAVGPGQGVVDGLPAPSLLSDLIEGTVKAERAKRKKSASAADGPAVPGGGPVPVVASSSFAGWRGRSLPKWVPRSHRRAFELAAARRAAEAAAGENEEKSESGEKMARPRQVAVPIQPYYYRSRKA
ncbi:MAG: hypothetical protein ACKOB0_12915, partial [Chthoniobacterales bacterium]